MTTLVVRRVVTKAIGMTSLLAMAFWASAASATTLSIDAASADWTSTNDSNGKIELLKGFTTGDWAGFVDVDASGATPGSVFAILFEVADPQTGQVQILGPNGLDQILAAGASEIVVPVALDAGINAFEFIVTGTGANSWTLSAAIKAVPLPAAAWMFISALIGLVLVGRRRNQYAAAPG